MALIIEEWNVKPQAGEIGIEIEMEGQNLKIDDILGWRAVHDGSLRGESIEYVLKTPKSRNKVDYYLKILQEALKNSWSILLPSNRCGIHIHINCQKLTTQQVFNFIILYLIFEDVLVKFCGKEREGNTFCLRAKDAEALIDALIIAKKEGSLRRLQHDNYRYASINISSIGKYGSLEFRAMRSLENFNEINPWINILLCIKDKSLEFNQSKEIIEAFSMNGYNRFSRQIFGNYFNLIKVENMNDLIVEGARRVQDIAFIDERY